MTGLPLVAVLEGKMVALLVMVALTAPLVRALVTVALMAGGPGRLTDLDPRPSTPDAGGTG